MILVQVNGYGVAQSDYEGLTVSQWIQKFKDENEFRFRGNIASMQETQTGRVLADDEILVDNRIYNLNAWLLKA